MDVVGPRLVLLGAPGSGKGTQAKRIAATLGIPAISTGEMLRQAVANGSELGQRVADVMSAGRLVEDELMSEVVRGRLAAPDARRGFVLDGYPRTAVQATTLDELLGEGGDGLDAVVLLDVPEEVLVERALGRGRADDQEDVVRARLAVYDEQTRPLVELYRECGLLRTVDGGRSIEEVTDAILGAIGGD
jgi:adenylate kinase